MPGRIQQVQDVAHGAAMATYATGATTIGFSYGPMEWLHEHAWFISMCCMVLTLIVMSVFRTLEFVLKLRDDKRKAEAAERAEKEFKRRKTDRE